MEKSELVRLALEAREMAYAPYSHWTVGAALLTAEGKVYKGCNIENASYTPTNCAERTAFFTAICEGERNFKAIAIVGGAEGKAPVGVCPPCGVCRQVMMEFCDYEKFEVTLGVSEHEFETYSLKDAMPMGFGPGDLGLPKPILKEE